MASLHLVPNPTVLAVQAGVFIANLFVIKKLMLEPYLKVRDRREQLTQGNRQEAEVILQRAEKISESIDERLTAASDEARKLRENFRTKAHARRQEILAAAEVDSKAAVERVEAEIRAELEQERSKIPTVVEKLTEDVYSAALS